MPHDPRPAPVRCDQPPARSLTVDTIAGHTFVSSLIDRGSLVVDLGFNHGAFSHAMRARYGCELIAVEPLPHLVEAARVGEGLRLLQAAVGPEPGETDLYVNPTRCATVDEALREPGGEVVRVRTVTLGELLEGQAGRRIALMKVDIEGAELDVLATASPELLSRIDQISVEFHDFVDPQMRPRVRSVVDRLEDLGFVHLRYSRGYGDVLFIARSRLARPRTAIAWLAVRFKYPQGLARLLRRTLIARAGGDGGGGR